MYPFHAGGVFIMDNIYKNYTDEELGREYKQLLESCKRYNNIYCRDDDSMYVENETLKYLRKEIRRRQEGRKD